MPSGLNTPEINAFFFLLLSLSFLFFFLFFFFCPAKINTCGMMKQQFDLGVCANQLLLATSRAIAFVGNRDAGNIGR